MDSIRMLLSDFEQAIVEKQKIASNIKTESDWVNHSTQFNQACQAVGLLREKIVKEFNDLSQVVDPNQFSQG